MSARTLVRDGIALTESGCGPPVLLVHGLGGFKESWGPLPEGLAASGRRVVAVDLPGWGDSPGRWREPHTPDWYAERLGPLASDLGRAIVVGHSLGAQVACRLAIRAPAYVGGLVLLSPQVVRRPPRGWCPRVPQDWAALPIVGPIASRVFFRAFLRDDVRLSRGFAAVVADRARFMDDPDAWALLDQAKERFRRSSPGIWAKALNRALRTDLRADADRIRAPTAVIVGAGDRITKPAAAISLAHAIPGATLVVLPDTGHLPQIEASRAVVDCVTSLSTQGISSRSRAQGRWALENDGQTRAT